MAGSGTDTCALHVTAEMQCLCTPHGSQSQRIARERASHEALATAADSGRAPPQTRAPAREQTSSSLALEAPAPQLTAALASARSLRAEGLSAAGAPGSGIDSAISSVRAAASACLASEPESPDLDGFCGCLGVVSDASSPVRRQANGARRKTRGRARRRQCQEDAELKRPRKIKRFSRMQKHASVG